MSQNPFPIFEQFSDRISASLFTKGDGVTSDKETSEKIGAEDFAGVWQVHGGRTVVTRERIERTEKADGIATDKEGLAIIVRWADCQNFAIYEPEKNVIAVLHSGWAGLLSEAIPNMFKVLNDEWEISASDVYVGAGPSLCLKCAEYNDSEHELRVKVDPKYVQDDCVDLRGIAEDQLASVGVQPDKFYRHVDCTRCSPQKYWTYRGGDYEDVKAGNSNYLCLVKN